MITRSRLLLLTSAALFGMTVLHDLDHIRQGRPLPTALTAVGLAGLLGAAICLVLAIRKHPLTAPAATLIGISSVIGLIAVHIVPHWSVLSDPYPDAQVDALSWTNLILLIAAALALGIAGLRSLRQKARAGN